MPKKTSSLSLFLINSSKNYIIFYILEFYSGCCSTFFSDLVWGGFISLFLYTTYSQLWARFAKVCQEIIKNAHKLKHSKIYNCYWIDCRCRQCGSGFDDYYHMKIHETNVHGYRCPVCKEYYASQSSVDRHVKSAHKYWWRHTEY